MSLRPSEEPYTTIARLRAEVERLKSEEECPACGPAIDRAEKAESERDEALSEVERLHYKSILYEGLKHRISQLERERDEALARVAVLLKELEAAQEYSGTVRALLKRLNLPAEARALLDRLQRVQNERDDLSEACGDIRKEHTRTLIKLQRAEAVMEAVRQRREFFEQEYGWICRGPQPWSAGVTEQDCVEFEALAAYEAIP